MREGGANLNVHSTILQNNYYFYRNFHDLMDMYYS